MLDVELECWELSVPIELGPLTLLVVVVPLDHELVFVLFGIHVVVIFFLVEERVDIAADLDRLLELHADFFFFLLVLCLAQGDDLFDGLVVLFWLQVEDVSPAELAHLVEVDVGEGILLCFGEDRASLDDKFVPD